MHSIYLLPRIQNMFMLLKQELGERIEKQTIDLKACVKADFENLQLKLSLSQPSLQEESKNG